MSFSNSAAPSLYIKFLMRKKRIKLFSTKFKIDENLKFDERRKISLKILMLTNDHV